MSTANETKLKYLQLAQNNGQQNLYNQEKAKAIANANSVLAQKYGTNATYDANKGFYDYGNAQPNYNMNNELGLYAQYQKAINDYQNADSTLQQYQTLQNDKNQALQNQAYLQQMGQKYMNNNMQAQGLNNSGATETAYTQLRNAYANNVGNINSNYATNVNDLYKQYANTKAQSQNNLDNSLLEYKQQALNDRQNQAEQRISEATSTADLESRYSPYKDVENDYLKQSYQDKYNELVLEEFKSKFSVSSEDTGIESSVLISRIDANNKNLSEANKRNRENQVINVQKAKNGYVTKVNGKFYVYSNGKWYKTNRDVYNAYGIK